MADRDDIFADLPPAGRKARIPLPPPPLPGYTADALWKLFAVKLEALNGRVLGIDELDLILSRPYFLDHDAAAHLGRAPGGVPIWEAEVGVTSADLAIAETGTVLLSTGPGKPRLASLTPVMHVVIIPREKIVATLAEAFSRLSDRTTVLITGPSRTADIEGVLVRGVHGPREIVVVPV